MQFDGAIQRYLRSECTAVDVIKQIPQKRQLEKLIEKVEGISEWTENKKLKSLHTIAQVSLDDLQALVVPISLPVEGSITLLPSQVLAKILDHLLPAQHNILSISCRTLRANVHAALHYCSEHLSRHLSTLLEKKSAYTDVIQFFKKCPQTQYQDVKLELTFTPDEKKFEIPLLVTIISQKFSITSLQFKEYIDPSNYGGYATSVSMLMKACPNLQSCRFLAPQANDVSNELFCLEYIEFAPSLVEVDLGPNLGSCIALQTLFSRCPNLKILRAEGISNDETQSSLLKGTFDIDADLDLTLKYPKTLEKLAFKNIQVAESCLQFLRGCPNLRHLELTDPEISLKTWLKAYVDPEQRAFDSLEVLRLDMNDDPAELFLFDDFEEEAVALLEETLEQNPTHLLALTFLAAHFWREDRQLDRAEQLLKTALQVNPRFSMALKLLGAILGNKEYLEQARALDPEDPFIHRQLNKIKKSEEKK